MNIGDGFIGNETIENCLMWLKHGRAYYVSETARLALIKMGLIAGGLSNPYITDDGDRYLAVTKILSSR